SCALPSLEGGHDRLAPNAATEEYKIERPSDGLLGEQTMEIVDARHGRTSDPHEQIPRKEAGSFGRATGLDVGEQDGSRRREMIAVRLPPREPNRLPGHAEVRATHATVPHQPRGDEFSRARRN